MKINGERWRAANPDKFKANCTKWQKDHPEVGRVKSQRFREKHPDRIKEISKKWRTENRDVTNAAKARRIASQLKATPCWANMKAIKSAYRMAKKLSESTGTAYHVDHIVPLRSKHVCGLHCEANLRVIPGSENQAKGNRRWPDMP